MASYVVTGASRGIGLEFVHQLSANANNKVFALVRNAPGATALKELASHAPNIYVIQADIVSVPALQVAAADVAKVTGGSLDYLINNAALIEETRKASTLTSYADGQADILEKDIQESIQVNVIGVIHTINAFLPLLQKGSVKKVISLSSGLGDPDITVVAHHAVSAPYSISKAALNMVVAKYAAEFKDDNFVFLAISPGLVNTAQAPPTPEVLEFIQQTLANFKRAYPDWDGKALTPENSVKQVLSVIEKVTVSDTGAFISHLGNKQWL